MRRARIPSRVESRRRRPAALALVRGFAAPGLRSILIAWVAALAIAFQCIVLQSHVHVGAAPAWSQTVSADGGAVAASSAARSIAVARTQSGDVDTRHGPSPAGPAGCFICQQMAMAGAAVLPLSPAPVIAQQTAIMVMAMAEVAALRPRASHDWRSRAPPIRL